MTLSYRNIISIAEVPIYGPSLIIAAILAIRHGFSRSAGWFFLIVFSLARLIGNSLELATISYPNNTKLYLGYAALLNIGLSPLMLATLGLLSRLLENINRTYRTTMSTQALKLVELVITGALVLNVIGGTKASNSDNNTGNYTPSTYNKVGTALYMVSYLAIVICTVIISSSVSQASHGEKRIIVAVGLALPFLLARVVYSSLSTFSHSKNFNTLTGSTTLYLCMAIVEEVVVVVLFEGVGLTLSRVRNDAIPEGAPVVQGPDGINYVPVSHDNQRRQSRTIGQKVLKVLSYTVIGKIISAFIPSNNDDVEMRKQYR